MIGYALDKVTSTIALIDELVAIDFPQEGPRNSLSVLKDVLRDLNDTLRLLDPEKSNPDLIHQTVTRATNEVARTLSFCGFAVNSSNVRNIFEIHDPLEDIAKQCLPSIPDIHLILSFEWNYVPFTYPLTIKALPGVIIIGLPASEAFNALIIPAAGHELGHSIWRVDAGEKHFQAEILTSILSLVGTEFWSEYSTHNRNADKNKLAEKHTVSTLIQAHKWATRQVEEMFCDIVGLGIFGESYLHTFKYLIAPSLSADRDGEYPSSKKRAGYLSSAATDMNIGNYADYEKSFIEERVSFDPRQYQHLLTRIADRCLEIIFPKLLEYSAAALAKYKISPPSAPEWTAIADEFRKYVPSAKPKSLSAIINAGWSVYLDSSFLPDRDTTPIEKRRLFLINELVLKSVEIFEIEGKIERYRQRVPTKDKK